MCADRLQEQGFERDPELMDLWRQAGQAGGRPIGILFVRKALTFTEHLGFVEAVATGPAVDHVLSASMGTTFDAKKVLLWNLQTGELIYTLLGHDDYVISLAFTPDGRHALSGSGFHSDQYDRDIRVWDLESGECIHTMRGHDYPVKKIAPFPDSLRAASAGGVEKSVRVWDLKTGHCQQVLTGHNSDVYCVAVSPAGRTIVSASEPMSYYLDKKAKETGIRWWHTETGRYLRTIETDSIGGLEFAADGRYLVSSHVDGFRLWDATGGELRMVKTAGGKGTGLMDLALDPTGRFAATAAGNLTRLWDLEDGVCLATLEGHGREVSSVRFSSDGQALISGNRDETVQVWELYWDYKFPVSKGCLTS